MAGCYEFLGIYYEKQGELAYLSGDNAAASIHFNEGLKNYSKALRIWENEDKGGISQEYNHLGDIYTKLKKYVTAREYFKKSLQLSNNMSDKESLRSIYLGLSKLDSIQGGFQEAYENYKLYIVYRDSLNNEQTVRKSEGYKIQYEREKEEVIAKVEEAKKTAEIKRVRNLQYSVIGFFLLIAIFLYLNNRQKQKAKVKIEKAYGELKSTQAQLIQSEKMASLGELTAGIAHEIQNPLNFVNNFSEVSRELIDELKSIRRNSFGEKSKLKDEEQDDILNDIDANLEKINHHGKRADAIVKGMLQHSRSSEGHKEPTDINALADEYLRLSFQGFRAKDKMFNCEIQTDFDQSLGKINIVPQDIGRVLVNLYSNAFYAVNEKKKTADDTYKPTVSISTCIIFPPPGGLRGAQISIKDNGIGISAKVVDKIFQPFFTTKPTGQGTGLGLSLSYDIIKAHGGKIKAATVEANTTTMALYQLIQHSLLSCHICKQYVVTFICALKVLSLALI